MLAGNFTESKRYKLPDDKFIGANREDGFSVAGSFSRMREFYTSVAVAFVVRVAAALAAFLLTLVIARTLGPEQSGYYFLAFSIVAILAALSRLGLDSTLVRFIGADNTQATSAVKKALVMAGAASLVSSVGLFALAEPLALHLFQKAELASVLRSISVGVTGLALLTLAGNALQGLGRVVPSILVTGVILNFSLIAALLLVQSVTADSLARMFALFSIATAFVGFLVFLRPHLGAKQSEIEYREILESCLPLLFVVVMQQLVQWSGLFIAGVYLQPESVSLLACAQRTAMLVSFVLVAVNLVVAPRFASLYRQGAMAELEKLALTSVKLVTALALPVILVMVVFPDTVMLLFGPEFVDGGPLLRILAVGQFLNAICGSVGILLIMSGNEKDVRNVVLISGTFALSSVWVLTAFYGESGNAIGTAAAIAGQNLMTVFLVRKRLGFNTLAVWRSVKSEQV